MGEVNSPLKEDMSGQKRTYGHPSVCRLYRFMARHRDTYTVAQLVKRIKGEFLPRRVSYLFFITFCIKKKDPGVVYIHYCIVVIFGRTA